MFYDLNKKKLGFFTKDDLTLIPYTTTKVDLKKKVSRLPSDVPIV